MDTLRMWDTRPFCEGSRCKMVRPPTRRVVILCVWRIHTRHVVQDALGRDKRTTEIHIWRDHSVYSGIASPTRPPSRVKSFDRLRLAEVSQRFQAAHSLRGATPCTVCVRARATGRESERDRKRGRERARGGDFPVRIVQCAGCENVSIQSFSSN